MTIIFLKNQLMLKSGNNVYLIDSPDLPQLDGKYLFTPWEYPGDQIDLSVEYCNHEDNYCHHTSEFALINDHADCLSEVEIIKDTLAEMKIYIMGKEGVDLYDF